MSARSADIVDLFLLAQRFLPAVVTPQFSLLVLCCLQSRFTLTFCTSRNTAVGEMSSGSFMSEVSSGDVGAVVLLAEDDDLDIGMEA